MVLQLYRFSSGNGNGPRFFPSPSTHPPLFPFIYSGRDIGKTHVRDSLSLSVPRRKEETCFIRGNSIWHSRSLMRSYTLQVELTLGNRRY